jgi:hypothetical protein
MVAHEDTISIKNVLTGQIYSNLANKVGCMLRTETLTCSAGVVRNYTFPNLEEHIFGIPIISGCSVSYAGITVGRNIEESGSIAVCSPIDQDVMVTLVMLV